MRVRAAVALLLLGLLAILLTGPARALVGGELDGERHPNVGILVGVDVRPQGEILLYTCSGTLVGRTAFLTAGHCLPEGLPFLDELTADGFTVDELRVSFGSSYEQGEDLLGPIPIFEPYVKARSWVLNPGYPGPDAPFDGTFIANDLGVVNLSKDPSTIFRAARPAALPPRDYLVTKALRDFTLVGYGVYAIDRNRENAQFDGARRSGSSRMAELQPDWFGVRGQPKSQSDEDRAVSCPGDSGGAIFHGGYLVGVISGGDFACKQYTVAPRLDGPIAQDFLAATGVIR